MRKIVAAALTILAFQFCLPQGESNVEFIKIADGLNFPEGPAWDGKGNLYVSSCHGGYIAQISADGTKKFIDSTSNPNLKQTNGLAVYKDGSIFACDYGLGAILKITPEGKSEIFIDGYDGKRFDRPNDLAFDDKGNLYFTDPKSYGKDKLDGRIFKVVIKSKVVKLLAELPGGDPDGLAFDIDGNLYAAHFGGGAIYVLSSDGKIKEKIIAPGKKPSNVEFGGDDMRTLFITEDETNSVYSTKVKIPGMPLFSSPVRN